MFDVHSAIRKLFPVCFFFVFFVNDGQTSSCTFVFAAVDAKALVFYNPIRALSSYSASSSLNRAADRWR